MEIIKFSIIVGLIITILHYIYYSVLYTINIEDIKRNIRKPRRQITHNNVKLVI